ncbi:MAG: hypothetical protein BroJett025_01090 [Patescibacteria group bacterium]|nr:MAG: hypothetical protein BroJett025_01090 [Patescibacteria group bacterium]
MNNFKFGLIALLFLSLTQISIVSIPVFAQETEDESTQSASFENIKKIIKENIENSKVKGAIDNLLNRKVALFGQIIRVTGETITITNRLGSRIIPLDETLTITRDGKLIKSEDIAVENWVTILGRIKDDDFSPVFLYVYTKSLLPKPQYVRIGTITAVTKNSITIKPRSDEAETTISIVKTTEFEDLTGTEISFSDLSEDLTVLVSGYNIESKIEASTIRSLAPLAESDE